MFSAYFFIFLQIFLIFPQIPSYFPYVSSYYSFIFHVFHIIAQISPSPIDGGGREIHRFQFYPLTRWKFFPNPIFYTYSGYSSKFFEIFPSLDFYGSRIYLRFSRRVGEGLRKDMKHVKNYNESFWHVSCLRSGFAQSLSKSEIARPPRLPPMMPHSGKCPCGTWKNFWSWDPLTKVRISEPIPPPPLEAYTHSRTSKKYIMWKTRRNMRKKTKEIGSRTKQR